MATIRRCNRVRRVYKHQKANAAESVLAIQMPSRRVKGRSWIDFSGNHPAFEALGWTTECSNEVLHLENSDQLLEGMSILVVEDNPVTAMDISMLLEDAGASVVGPFATVTHTYSVVDDRMCDAIIDAAILDVELQGETSVPIAQLMDRRGIPFLFYTGISQSDTNILAKFNAQILPKPSASVSLINAVVQLLEN